MKIKEITNHIESIAPLAYQESYDNAGLIVGSSETEVSGILICLDSTEDVIVEAINKKCNLVIAHHPIIFTELKKFTGKNYVERTIVKAIKNDIAIYAAHTNLDNVSNGVNSKICDVLGLTKKRILSEKNSLLRKLITFCPLAQAEKVRLALFNAGAGSIGNYDQCSFNTDGTGTFRALEGANPFVGEIGEINREQEQKIETIYPLFLESKILKALFESHPYEEVAYDIISLQNNFQHVGSGMIAELEVEMDELEFLKLVKTRLKSGSVRYTGLLGKKVKKIAVCGGSGSFLLSNAVSAGADIFITADYKYHQFFDADGKIVIADVGHFESEQFTMDLFSDIIKEKFPKFAVHLSETKTNPINYL